MFKTIRLKIIVLSLIMLAVLISAVACYVGVFRMKTKQLMLQNYAFSINSFVQQVDEKIIRAEDNSKDLALIGSLFYRTDRSIPLTNNAIIKIFENYENSLGGGIWFEPYAVYKDQKRVCFYAYRDKSGNIILDDDFSSEQYDYHNQSWYKEIISQIDKEHPTAWSLPYYENQGSKTTMITVGTGIYVGDKLIGISTVDWELDSVFQEISEMKPLENGFSFYETRDRIKGSFSLFASEKYNYIIVSDDPYLDNDALVGKTLDNIPWYRKDLYDITYFKYHGKLYTPFVKYTNNDMLLIICVPKTEMYKDINKFTLHMLLFLIMAGILIPIAVYAILNKYIINPINKLTEIAKKIGNGEDVEIKIEKPEEFAQLASTFNKMTDNIKTFTKDQAKILSELNIAKQIQESSLPNKFPPFPDRKEFEIFASMEPAKEVGGDFYDFYFIDENKDNFIFLIADVAGKGIPSALFMMTAKTLIKSLAKVGYPPKELAKKINHKICANNKHGFFITMFSGIINLKTGKAYVINCGHNKPLIRHQSGSYEYMELDNNLPLGVFDDYEFNIHEFNLEKGDIIFTYTDGITEAMNNDGDLYGEQRLLETLNYAKTCENSQEIVSLIKNDIKIYTNSATQSDDITMLCFKYLGENSVKVYNEVAKKENYKSFCNWLHSNLKEWEISKDLFNDIDMCSEEIFANISFYAYPEKQGMITVSIDKKDDEIIMVFEDSGIKYNPLEKPDPDITLPPQERPLGGLGIFMVKKITKNVYYERKEDKNILTLVFDCK